CRPRVAWCDLLPGGVSPGCPNAYARLAHPGVPCWGRGRSAGAMKPADYPMHKGTNPLSQSWLRSLCRNLIRPPRQRHASDPSYTVKVTAIDLGDTSESPSNTTQFTVKATNVAPTPALGNVPATSPEGTRLSLAGSATDPSDADTSAGFTYSWSVLKIASDGT